MSVQFLSLVLGAMTGTKRTFKTKKMENLPDIQTKKLVAKLNAAGLTRKLLKSINNYPGNTLVKVMIAAAQTHLDKSVAVEIDLSAFEKIAEFKIVIPDYSLADYIKIFKEKFEFMSVDVIGINDNNFHPSVPLIPGETKMASIYRIIKPTEYDNCFAFASKKGQLPNAQGIAAIWFNNFEAFNNNLYLLGLDAPENLYQDATQKRQMAIIGKNSLKLIFDTIPIGGSLSPGFCIAIIS